jgi:hypothetical protein
MKKIVVSAVFLMAAMCGTAQTLDEINAFIGKSQFSKAKEGIDKFLLDAKNNTKPDGWFFKGRVYNALSKDSSIAPEAAAGFKKDAFEAFKKYQQLDPKNVRLILENNGSFFDLYNGFFDLGAKGFGAKNYALAFNTFKNALAVEDYVRTKGYDYNGYKFPDFDTSLVLNTGLSARIAKMDDDAIVYYRQLADKNVNQEQFLEVYQYLIEQYGKKNDMANKNAMLAKGRALYPTNDYWMQMELDAAKDAKDKPTLYAKYEELMKSYPSNYTLTYNYAVELYNDMYTATVKPKDMPTAITKLTDVLKTAISLADKTKDNDANTLMSRHLFNAAVDYEDNAKLVKGSKPDDVKKRAALKAQAIKMMDACIPYTNDMVTFFSALPKLRPVQKQSFRTAYDVLSQIYSAKGDVKKSAEYNKKKLEVDKMQ